MTTAKLIEQAHQLYDVIYNINCFNAKDMVLLDKTVAELQKRGFNIQEEATRLRITRA